MEVEHILVREREREGGGERERERERKGKRMNDYLLCVQEVVSLVQLED